MQISFIAGTRRGAKVSASRDQIYYGVFSRDPLLAGA